MRLHQSQHGQDLWALLALREPGYFVEFGAYDGIEGSNTLAMEDAGWHGICAEPTPGEFDKLRENRRCHCDHSAVTRDGGADVELTICKHGQLSGIASGFADMHKRKAIRDRVMVPSLSLVQLLDKYDAPAFIDYLSVDTEGTEPDILEGFDYRRARFGAISVEHNSNLQKRGRTRHVLGENGYLLRRSNNIEDYFTHYAATPI